MQSHTAMALQLDPIELGPEPGCTRPVLVAEDDDEMRQLIASTLRADGYAVVEARNGVELLDQIEDAVRRVRRDDFALVISDVRMPELTGLDVLTVLACSGWRTPVIVITAFGSQETHDDAFELGAFAVLDKPFDLDELRGLVRRAVPRR